MTRTALHAAAATLLLVLSPAQAQDESIARTPSGRPDLTGSYDVATLTPFERPRELGTTAYLTPEEAQAIADRESNLQQKGAAQTGGDREAPPEGGAKVVGLEETETGGNEFGAGNVGAYNLFWMDRGADVFRIDGKIPTSILLDPPDGRMPPVTASARAKLLEQASAFGRENDGSAWWLELEGPGPYDGPESLPLRERCLLGFTGVAPTIPALYNNFKRIVQTEDRVMILLEMVHDARVVRLDSEHPPADVRFWLGDSIGWWEGDTLVVDTTNFLPHWGLRAGGSETKHVVERFTPQPDGNLIYRFTVRDDAVWEAPFSGEYLWRASEDRVYEYACHEGNYAMVNVLRGARLLEREARE